MRTVLIAVFLMPTLLGLYLRGSDRRLELVAQAPNAMNQPLAPTVSFIAGRVYDARTITPSTILPDELKGIEGATVRVPTLRLTGQTDASGHFRFDGVVVPSSPYLKVNVEVTKAGFGGWILRGGPVRPSGNGLLLTVLLQSQLQDRTYIPIEESGKRPDIGVDPLPRTP